MAKPETVSEVLNAAADLLMRTGWCQGTLAKTRYGDPISVMEPDAERFCSYGAIYRVVWTQADAVPISEAAGSALRCHVKASSVSAWNDTTCTRRAQVVAAMRAAAAKAEGTHQ